MLKRSMGRLIGLRHQYLGLSIANGSTRFNSSKTSPVLHPSRELENPNSIYYEVEEAKGGSDNDQLIQTANCTKKEEVEKVEFTNVKKGDNFNLSDLLFTKYRDHLVKCNEDKRVKSEQLTGKVVVIYFASVLSMNQNHIKSLMQVYSDLWPINGFEVVFVDVNDDSLSGVIWPAFSYRERKKHYEDILSSMPWTAIPLSDITSRKQLKQRFGLPEVLYVNYSFVIDSTGKLLQHGDLSVFHRYGAPGYPFSDERINYLKSEDDRVARQPSLKELLASPQRDYLISNKGDKVPIHTLEDKVVALYFYEEGVTNKNITRELKTVYEKLAENNEKFEVVLIYLYDTLSTHDITNEDSFWQTFKDMPWLALPFKDPNYKKLERIFFYPWDSDFHDFSLIIIGPHMEFIEPFGVLILGRFKIPAFPFSREKVAELLTAEAKELKLEMLWDPESVFGEKYGFQIPYSQLAGKRVIIIFEWFYSCEWEASFLETLKERYIELKGTADEFEVIHIVEETFDNETNVCDVANLPWFVQPAGAAEGYECNLFNFYKKYDCYNGGCSLVAFDRDGRLVRRTIYPTVEDLNFPFHAGGLEEEALPQLIEAFEWDGWNSHKSEIYSYKKDSDLT
ncbi:hypothetical protein OROMI_002902 [Orobanche minor]